MNALRRFKPYPAYKDSGVEWLGEIPAHWEVKMLKRLGAMQAGTAITADDIEPAGEYPVFGGNGVRGYTDDFTHEGQFPLIGRQGALCGCVNFATGKFWASEHAVVVTPYTGTDPCWLTALLQSMSLNRYSQSAAQPGLAVETIGTVHAPHPPDLEQRAIAAFLDRETARIDALVAKKERLIELLQEKRTALITRAVTKGLDPTVPMKDSGVEWLGEIPAHWEAPPLKRAIYYVEGPGIMASDFMPEGVPLLRISGIGGRKATLQGCNYLSIETVEEKWKQFRVRCGDLLISGSASTGFCTEVDEETEGAIPYTGIIIVRPRIEDVARDFVRWMLLSNLFTTQAELTRSGTTIQHFGPSHLARMRVVHPPLEEQQAIAAFLDRETAKVDALIAKVREAIERLKELRTALISAAVTGKIDVREEAA